MPRDARLQGFEAWMDAAMNGGGWLEALQTSVDLLHAQAVAIVCRDGDAAPVVSADLQAPAAFVQFCRALTPRRSAGLEERDLPGLGRVVWIRVEGRAAQSLSDVTFAMLSDGQADLVLLAEIAMVAARAVAARSRLASTQAASALMTAAFDHLPFGIVIADKDARVAQINDACRALLVRADGLSVLKGRLMCRDARDQRELLGAIATILAGQTASVVRVARSGGAEPYVVRVICPREDAGGRDYCLLMIVDPDDQPAPGPDIWRAMFDLTDCELIIAEGLVAGRRITDIANARGVSVETVRTQTKRMFERLNVSSQSEATARLCRVTPFRAGGALVPKIRRCAAA